MAMKRQLLNKSTNAHSSGIAAGQTNRIGDNLGTAANHSFIGGGQLNCICAQHSAILGGNNNKVTHNCAGVFGNGVNSAAANTFHVNCLNAVSTPLYAAIGIPPGTLTYINPTPAMVADGFPLAGKIAILI